MFTDGSSSEKVNQHEFVERPGRSFDPQDPALYHEDLELQNGKKVWGWYLEISKRKKGRREEGKERRKEGRKRLLLRIVAYIK